MSRTELSPANRTVAAVLGFIWIIAGVGAAIVGMMKHHWLALLLSPLAVVYGIVWLRVARTGRRLQFPMRRR